GVGVVGPQVVADHHGVAGLAAVAAGVVGDAGPAVHVQHVARIHGDDETQHGAPRVHRQVHRQRGGGHLVGGVEGGEAQSRESVDGHGQTPYRGKTPRRRELKLPVPELTRYLAVKVLVPGVRSLWMDTLEQMTPAPATPKTPMPRLSAGAIEESPVIS